MIRIAARFFFATIFVALAACSDEEAGQTPCDATPDCPLDQTCGGDGLCSVPEALACESGADCGGYACVGVTEDAFGACEFRCQTSDDCNAGYACNDTLCELTGSTCRNDAECDRGFACIIADGADEGVCPTSCASNADCAEGLDCDDNGVCRDADPDPCETDEDCAPYGCIAGVCGVDCDEGSDCSPGAQCDIDTRTCGFAGGLPYAFLGITSEVLASSQDVMGTNTPGPDIDGTIVVLPNRNVITTASITALQGTAGSSGNDATELRDGVGSPDVVPDAPGECDLSGGYWSMGASDGFAVFTFDAGLAVEDGSTLEVYEVADDRCTNAPARNDQYGIYLNITDVAADATQMRDEWCLIRESDITGGVTVVDSVDLSVCE